MTDVRTRMLLVYDGDEARDINLFNRAKWHCKCELEFMTEVESVDVTTHVKLVHCKIYK